MKKSGDVVTIRIEKLVEGGKGMGRYKDRPLFVPLVLPGEEVRVQIIRYHRQYFEGELLQVIESSGERVDPPCPYFGRCGGCQWQHMVYEAQGKWKEIIFKETLKRIGKLENPVVLSLIPSPKTLSWRSRATFHGDKEGRIGFFAPETHRVVDIERCLIVEESLNDRLKEIRRENLKEKRDYEVRADNRRGFAQVNELQNQNLKRLVREWSENIPHETVLELFCGSGNFTEVLLPMAKKITAVDSDQEAIAEAKKLLSPNGSALLNFVCTDAVRFFANFVETTPLDLLLLDPPRDGAAGFVEGVLKTKPMYILYISCNPATLARDLKYLKDFAGYELVQSQPIDMFPMSYHIESLSLIRRGS